MIIEEKHIEIKTEALGLLNLWWFDASTELVMDYRQNPWAMEPNPTRGGDLTWPTPIWVEPWCLNNMWAMPWWPNPIRVWSIMAKPYRRVLGLAEPHGCWFRDGRSLIELYTCDNHGKLETLNPIWLMIGHILGKHKLRFYVWKRVFDWIWWIPNLLWLN